MRKKIIILLSGLLIIIAIALPYIFNRTSDNQKTGQGVYLMTGGKMIELKSNISIIAEGVVGLERKKVEFTITPQTVLKNEVTILVASEAKEGEVYHPKTEIRRGNQSDFVVGMWINEIKSKEDLLINNKATATEIFFATFEFK